MTAYREIQIGSREIIAAPAEPAPDLKWLPISDIVIDEAYQRPLLRSNWKAIEKIAREFKWSRFTPVLVAPVEGGKFALIDGQHRTHAAKLRGLPVVPAMIVPMSAEEQAMAFAHVNGNVIKITNFHIYRAALAAREDWAVRAEAAVSDAGCQLMTSNISAAQRKPGQIFMINLIRKFVTEGLDELVTIGLTALRKSPGSNHTDYFLLAVVKPWLEALETDQRFLAMDLAAFLEHVDLTALVDDLRQRRKNTGDRSPMHPQLRAIITQELKEWQQMASEVKP